MKQLLLMNQVDIFENVEHPKKVQLLQEVIHSIPGGDSLHETLNTQGSERF